MNSLRNIQKDENDVNLLRAYSEIMGRLNLGAKVGMQYDGKRDIYQSLGYPNLQNLKFENFYGKYRRHEIAKAVIDRPVGATWRGVLEIEENETPEMTEFEKGWEILRDNLKLKDRFSRLDKLASIGGYAILALGFNDVKTKTDWAKPIKKGMNVKLKYVKPYSESSASILTYETDSKNERYGMPVYYTLKTQQGDSVDEIKVHYTRIIHIVGDALESELFGVSELESIYNRLLDLEKIVGGDGEMFWRGARPGYAGNIDPNFQVGPKTKDDIKEQINEFENGLRRILINTGIDLKGLEQQIADPSKHFEVQIQSICAKTGIPKRILLGSERGELSSAQDSDEWRSFIQERREEKAEIKIVKPFIDTMIEFGVLPMPKTGKYFVKWPNSYDLNPKEKSEVGKNMAVAIKEYTTNPIAESIIPPTAFMEIILGLEPYKINRILQLLDEEMTEDQIKLRESLQSIVDKKTQTSVA